MSDEKYEKILEVVLETKVSVTTIKEDIVEMKQDLRQNTTDLTEHKLGVITAQEAIKLEKSVRSEELQKIDDRLKEVEFIPNLGKSLWKVLKVLGGTAAAAVAISKFMGLW